jgi:hypothetical protein
MTDTAFAINILSIVVGVLIARIIFIWIMTFKVYVESTETYDRDIAETDYHIAEKRFISALVCTGIGGLIIILIVEFYRGKY